MSTCGPSLKTVAQVEGETAITRAKKQNNLVIQKIWLEPAGVPGAA